MIRRMSMALLSAFALAASPSHADRLHRGSSVVWLGLHGNQAQFLSSPLTIRPGDEIGAHIAWSWFLSDAWAANVSGGVDAGHTRIEVPTLAPIKSASHSWNGRIGFDRYGFIGDDVALYAGPGLRYWTGHAELHVDSGSFKSHMPDVHQIAFNGRLGMWARVTRHVGLFGHIGQVLGWNRSKSDGLNVKWLSNSHEGSVGLAVDL